MAVDSFRSAFHFNRVEADEIGFLISAQSYRPEITRAIRTIRNWNHWKKLQDICSNKISPGPHPKYSSSGHPCLKTKNVLGLIASTDEIDWVSPTQAATLKRFFVQNENILLNLTGAGSIGRVSIYFGNSQPLTNQHIARLEINKPYDSSYVCSFLSSWWGERAIEQGISGTTGQLNLVNDHVRSLPIPIPDRLVQNYIGDKVRLAEKLRERSKELEKQGIKEFNAYFGSFIPIPFKKHYQTLASQLDNRIDTWFYNPRFLWAVQAIEDAQAKLTPLGEIATQITNGGTPRNARFGSRGIRWIRGKDFEHGDIENIDSLPLLDFASEQTIKRSRLKVGDIILSIKGTVGDVAVVDELLEGCNTNQDVAKIEIGNLEDANFIASFFESELGKVLIEQQVYGAVNAFFSLENLRLFGVPDPSSVKADFKSKVSGLRYKSILYKRLSQVLTTAAKYLVEALIEGKLTETELKNAQTALLKEDIEPDKAILTKLTRKGYDISEEPPLFPDLDALYQATREINPTSEL